MDGFRYYLFCFILQTDIGGSVGNSNPVMTLSSGGAKGCLGHRFRAPPAYTAQLLRVGHPKNPGGCFGISVLRFFGFFGFFSKLLKFHSGSR